jgi:hypothetical protein
MFVVRCELEKFHFRYSQHFIFFVTEKTAKQTRMFVPGRLLQPSLMFASKAGAYPSVAMSVGGAKHVERLWPYLQTSEKHSSLLGRFISCQ